MKTDNPKVRELMAALSTEWEVQHRIDVLNNISETIRGLKDTECPEVGNTLRRAWQELDYAVDHLGDRRGTLAVAPRIIEYRGWWCLVEDEFGNKCMGVFLGVSAPDTGYFLNPPWHSPSEEKLENAVPIARAFDPTTPPAGWL